MHVWPKVPRGVIASCLFTLREAIHACWFGEVQFDPCSLNQRRTGGCEDNLELGGGKEVRSKMGSMSSWLKANSSRGEDRRRWLEHFLVVQLRSKQTQKTTKVQKQLTH